MSFKYPVLSLFLVIISGCSQSQSTETARNAGGEDRPVVNSTDTIELPDIGEPDEKTRKVDGILIVGSALNDAHIYAIRKLTDEKAPRNAEKNLRRNIQHKAPNQALNIWQGTHFESYQSLVLVDGEWKLEKTGGGFGKFN